MPTNLIDPLQTELYLRNALAFLAQSYVGVRECGGDNKGPMVEMFQKAVDGKANREPWCFRADHQILTSRGWINIDQVVDDEIVAQVNPDTKKIEMVKIVAKIEKPYCGEMVNIKTRTHNIHCDPNHEFWGYWNKSTKLAKQPIGAIKTSLSIPVVSGGGKDSEFSDKDLQFLAAFMCDGFLRKSSGQNGISKQYNRIEFSVSKHKKIERLKQHTPIGLHKNKNTYGKSRSPLTIISFKIPDWFFRVFDGYKCLKWDFVHSLSQRQSSLFLKEMAFFDGYARGKSIMIFTSRVLLKDQLTAIVMIAGYSPTITSQTSKISGKPCYCVRFNDRFKNKTIKKSHISYYKDDLILYCVQVPSGIIVMRDANQNAFVTGNCLSFVQYCVKQAQSCVEAITMQSLEETPLVFSTEHVLTMWNKSPKELRREIPRSGDLLLWQKYDSNGKPTTSGHVGVVVQVLDEKELWTRTVEGNTSGEKDDVREGDVVALKTRNIHYNYGSLRPLGVLSVWG